MKKFEIEVKQTITEEQIRDILIDGIETGIGYWATLDNTTEEFKKRYETDKSKATSEIVGDIILEGGEVSIIDTDQDVEPLYKLNLERLLIGIKRNIEERPFDCDLEYYDSITCDCIIQYAIFDELIFG